MAGEHAGLLLLFAVGGIRERYHACRLPADATGVTGHLDWITVVATTSQNTVLHRANCFVTEYLTSDQETALAHYCFRYIATQPHCTGFR